MLMVMITALGVGGATVFGAIMGLLFKKISHRFSDIVLAFPRWNTVESSVSLLQ